MATQSCEKIKTFCRVRPSNEELSENVVRIDGNRITVNLKDDPKSFNFNGCYGQDSSQEDVFHGAASRIVQGTLQGYNGTIFAYGQTGSGKTHTMIGPSNKYDKNAGIIPRGLHQLFEQLDVRTQEMPGTFTAKITVSFVEIYNEFIYDLFVTSDEKLKIGQDSEGNAVVKGVTEIFVKDLNDAMEEVRRGWNNRSVAETAMNRSSSRSHALLLIKIRTEEVHGSISTARSAFLNLVDLAGSERVSQSKVEGERLKETNNINKSLLQLKLVIRELSEHKKEGFIPFRNSVLTHILKDSLGGNARTAVMINVHPNKQYYSETLATLQFAADVSRIENKVIVNEDLKGDSVVAFKAEIKRLQEEMEKMQNKNSEEMGEMRRSLEAWQEAAHKYERQLAVARRNALNTAIVARKDGNAASLAEDTWEKSMAEVEQSVRKLPTTNIRSLQLKELTEQLNLCTFEKDELQSQLDDERKAKAEVQEKLNSFMMGVVSPARKNRLESASSQSNMSSMVGNNPLDTSVAAKSAKKARRMTLYEQPATPREKRNTFFRPVRPVLDVDGEEEAERNTTPVEADNCEERRELELEMKLNQKEQIVDEKTRECENLDRLLKDAEKRISEAEEKCEQSLKSIEEEEMKVKELTEKLDRAEKTIEEENEKVADLERRASNLNEELIETKAQVDSLQSDMELLTSTHQDELKELERKLKTNLSDKEKKEVDLKLEIDSLKGEIDAKNQELANKMTEKKAADDILVMLSENVKKIDKERQEAVHEMEAANCQLKEIHRAMERERGEVEEERQKREEEHRRTIVSLEEDADKKRKKVEEEKEKREEEHRRKIASLEEEVDKKKEELEEERVKMRQMESSSSSEFNDLQEDMQRLRITKEKELATMNGEIDHWKNVSLQFSSKIDEMRIELDGEKEKRSETEARAKRKEELLRLQSSELEDLKENVGQLGSHSNPKQKIHLARRLVEEKGLLRIRVSQLEAALRRHGLTVPQRDPVLDAMDDAGDDVNDGRDSVASNDLGSEETAAPARRPLRTQTRVAGVRVADQSATTTASAASSRTTSLRTTRTTSAAKK